MPDERFDYTYDGQPIYPPEHWARDHATLLLYVEVRHLDHEGQLVPDNLRTNAERHPHEWGQRKHTSSGWKLEYATRILDGTRPSDTHDDWDCLDDLEDAGLLIHSGPPNLLVALTDVGIEVAGELRKFKGRGNPVSDFDWQKAIADAEGKVGQ